MSDFHTESPQLQVDVGISQGCWLGYGPQKLTQVLGDFSHLPWVSCRGKHVSIWLQPCEGQDPSQYNPWGTEEHPPPVCCRLSPQPVSRALTDPSCRNGTNKIAVRRRAMSDGLQLSLCLSATPAPLQM